MIEGKDQWMPMCQLKRANDVRELFVARAGLLQKRAHGYCTGMDIGRSVDVGGKGDSKEGYRKGLAFDNNRINDKRFAVSGEWM
jgi:hypothetical protein